MATTMNVFSSKLPSDLDIEEYSLIHQYHMNSLVGDAPHSLLSFDHDITTCYNFDASCNYIDLVEDKPSKIPKNQPSSRIISFENMGLKIMNHNSPNLTLIPKEDAASPELITRGKRRAQPLSRSQLKARDHVLLERKRREKLTERFVALSAVVPGLKKMDKASVLGGAVKHIKYLQESVTEYEEQKKAKTLESMVLINKSLFVLDDSYQASDEIRDLPSSNLPEIEVRVSGKDVLIKIQCEKQKGLSIKIMEEIEKLGLFITNSSVLPFGSTFDTSVIARKKSNFDMKIEDVVKNLSCGISKLI